MDGLLKQILAAIKQLGIVILSRLGLIDLNMNQLLGDVDLVKAQVQLISTAVTTLTANVATVQATADIITTDLGADTTLILAAIGSPAQASVAPSWWVPPSGGGSAPTADENASAVWGFLAGGQALEMGALLEEAGNLAVNTARAGGIPSQFSPWLRLLSPLDTQHDDAPDFGPLLRADHILLADTVLTWAQREAPTYGWFLDSSSHAVMGNYPSPHGAWFLLIDLDPGQFQAIKAALGLVASGVGAPVWPGIAGVTLGAPVALSPTCVVTGPMHGVIIEITSAAPRQVYQVFGGMQGYRFVGGLQFVDDNGEAERIQSIGMQHEVILCKSMAVAASCSIRTDSAVTGTATPFVIT